VAAITMKRFEEFNYYEILEIPCNASTFQIREAYRDALSLYSEDSLATYSLFTAEERHRILDRVEKAFNTLIDKKARDEYDKSLLNSGLISDSQLERKDQKKPIPLFPTPSHNHDSAFLRKIRKRIEEEGKSNLSGQILSKEIISGYDLKGLRESLGISLVDIYEVSRVSISTLEAIEGDETENLPPDIYLVNFLKIYAELLQLDQKKIVDGYLQNIRNKNTT
jgi:DnaJ-class molecular chaperone